MHAFRSLVALVFIASASPAADWPQWLGVKRDGGTTETVAPWKEAPKALWREAVGGGFSSPVVAGGRVFVHAQVAGKEEEEVIAFDEATGKIAWRQAYPRPEFKSVLGTGPRATPTISGKRLFALGINGILTCFDTAEGKLLWQVDLYKKFQATLPAFAVCCSPLVVGDRVIVSVGGKGQCVVALKADSGEVAWQALDDAASTSSPVLFAGGPRPAGSTPDVVIMTPLRLVGLDPIEGALRWQHPMVFQPQGTSPTPVRFGDRLVASTQAHGAVAVQLGLDDEKLSASQSWQNKDMKSYFSSGATFGDKLFLVTNQVEVLPAAHLTCVDARTGKKLWTKERVGYFHAGLIRLGDGKLLVLSDGGILSLLESGESGAVELARSGVCRGTLVSPALANGRLFVRDDRELICLPMSKTAE